MYLYKKYPMTFEGKKFEIRVFYDDNLINVAAFMNNYPANGFRHQVLLPKNCIAEKALEKGAAADLVEMAMDDIRVNRWEKIRPVIIENSSTPKG